MKSIALFKKMLYCLLVAALLLGLSSTGGLVAAWAAPTNLIVNGGFEAAFNPGGAQNGWGGYPGWQPNWTAAQTAFTITSEEAHSGAQSMKLTTVAGLQWSAWMYSVVPGIKQGEEYSLSLWTKGGASSTAYLKFLDGTSESGATIYEGFLNTADNNEWRKHEYTIIGGSSGNFYILLQVGNNAAGRVIYFDDFELYWAGDDGGGDNGGDGDEPEEEVLCPGGDWTVSPIGIGASGAPVAVDAADLAGISGMKIMNPGIVAGGSNVHRGVSAASPSGMDFGIDPLWNRIIFNIIIEGAATNNVYAELSAYSADGMRIIYDGFRTTASASDTPQSGYRTYEYELWFEPKTAGSVAADRFIIDIWLNNTAVATSIYIEDLTFGAGSIPAGMGAMSSLLPNVSIDHSQLVMPATISPADPDATEATKRLLAFLHGVNDSDYIMVGTQNATFDSAGGSSYTAANYPNRPPATGSAALDPNILYYNDMRMITGEYPAVMGINGYSFFGIEGGGASNTADRVLGSADLAKQWAANGGIITLSCHMPNFARMHETRGAYLLTEADIIAEFGNNRSSYSGTNGVGSYTTDVIDKILPGGEANYIFTCYLDQIAKFAKSLDEADIPVLFRPFHEHNHEFWWGLDLWNAGADGGAYNVSADDFIRLWRYTVEYLRDEKDVHNLLYVISPNGWFTSQDTGNQRYNDGYPGDEYVDICGFDIYYNTGSAGHLASMDLTCQVVDAFAKAHNKVAALTEFGQNAYSGDGFGTPLAESQPTYYPTLLDYMTKDGRRFSYMSTWWMGSGSTSRYYPYLIAPTRAYSNNGESSISPFINVFINSPATVFAGGHGFYEFEIAENLFVNGDFSADFNSWGVDGYGYTEWYVTEPAHRSHFSVVGDAPARDGYSGRSLQLDNRAKVSGWQQAAANIGGLAPETEYELRFWTRVDAAIGGRSYDIKVFDADNDIDHSLKIVDNSFAPNQNEWREVVQRFTTGTNGKVQIAIMNSDATIDTTPHIIWFNGFTLYKVDNKANDTSSPATYAGTEFEFADYSGWLAQRIGAGSSGYAGAEAVRAGDGAGVGAGVGDSVGGIVIVDPGITAGGGNVFRGISIMSPGGLGLDLGAWNRIQFNVAAPIEAIRSTYVELSGYSADGTRIIFDGFRQTASKWDADTGTRAYEYTLWFEPKASGVLLDSFNLDIWFNNLDVGGPIAVTDLYFGTGTLPAGTGAMSSLLPSASINPGNLDFTVPSAGQINANATPNTVKLFDFLYAVGQSEYLMMGVQNATYYNANRNSPDSISFNAVNYPNRPRSSNDAGREPLDDNVLYYNDLRNITGEYPAIMGFDAYGFTAGELPGVNDLENRVLGSANLARQWVANGGIITLSNHMPNCAILQQKYGDNLTRAEAYAIFDSGECYANGSASFYSRISGGSGLAIKNVLPGGPANYLFNYWLDLIVEFSLELQKDDIPVIFRPFHEHTGGFWWALRDNSAQDLVALWQYTYNYLTDAGANNFLYAYSPDNFGAGSSYSYMDGWPGDEYVDICGYDLYSTISANVRSRISTVNEAAKSRGKIAALTEIGLSGNHTSNGNFYRDVRTELNAAGMDFAYIMTWHNGWGTNWYPFLTTPTRAAYNNATISAFINGFVNDPTVIFAGGHGFYQMAGGEPGAPIDKSLLESLINEAEALDEAEHTVESWAGLEAVLPHARDILAANSYWLAQGDVDAAAAALSDALAALVRLNTAYIYITGPDSVASGGGATATYTISAKHMPTVSGIELEFEVDGAFLASNSFTALGGFKFFGNGNYGTPIFWKEGSGGSGGGSGTWIGKVTLLDLDMSGISGDVDILELVFNVHDGVLGEAAIKINYVNLSFPGNQIGAVYVNESFTTLFIRYYSPYDLNKDGVVDINDLTFALQYLSIQEGDSEWDSVKHMDFNDDKAIEIGDLILILANYTIPYYT